MSGSPLSADARRAVAILSGYPLPGAAPLTELRANARTIMERLAAPGPPLPMVRDDRTDDGVPVRLYVPPEATADLLVYARGSGWVAGSIDEQDPLVRRLSLATRSPVISVDYRLAPEHRFPAALDDVLAAVRSAAALSRRAGGPEPRRIGVVGQSAGANLAAGAAIALRDACDPVDLQVLIDPVLRDHRRAAGLVAPPGDFDGVVDVLRWEWDQYLPEPPTSDLLPLAVPWEVDSVAGLPATIVVTAGCDLLAGEGAAYAARLRAAGVPTELHEVPGAIHGFLDHTRVGDVADRELQKIAALIRSAWGAPPCV